MERLLRIAPALAALVLLAALFALPAGAAARTIRTAVIVVHFEGEELPPGAYEPLQSAEATVFGSGPLDFGYSAREYFQSITYGQVDYAGTASNVFGWYEIAPYEGFCNYGKWMNEAWTEAAKDGFDNTHYDQIVYYLEPSIVAEPCAYGVGSVGSTFMKGINPYVTVHELGHGLAASGFEGSPHAGALRCTENGVPVAYSATCEELERGDPFDPMGNNVYPPLPMTAWRLLNFGAIPAGDAPTIAFSGTYAIAPLEQSSGTRLLRIPTGDGRFFDLDFRQRTTFYDSGLPPDSAIYNGVGIRVDPPKFEKGTQSLLLDTVPGTETFDDAPLAPGRSFRDFRTGVTVETLAAGPGGATVKIGGLPDPPVPDQGARCVVPKVKGKKAKAAKKALRKRECGVRVKRRSSKGVPKGKVISQKPKAGAVKPEDTKVSIVVSSGPPEGGRAGK